MKNFKNSSTSPSIFTLFSPNESQIPSPQNNPQISPRNNSQQFPHHHQNVQYTSPQNYARNSQIYPHISTNPTECL